MFYQYVVDRVDVDKDPSVPLSMPDARHRLRDRTRIHRGKGWRVRTRHGEFGRVHGWYAARRACWSMMWKGKAGSRAVMRSELTGAVFTITKVADEPKFVDLLCAAELSRIHAYVWERGGVRTGGRWYCRYVDGTNTVSRHGYRGNGWEGAAEDIFVLSDRMSDLIALAEFIVGLAEKGEIHPHAVVVADREWRPESGWGSYGGIYHRHCHVDVADGVPCRP